MSDVFAEQIFTVTRGNRLLDKPVHLFVNPVTFRIPSPYAPHTAALPDSFVRPEGVGAEVHFGTMYETSMVTRRAFNEWLLKGKSPYFTAALYTLLHDGSAVHKVVAGRFDELGDYYLAQNHLVTSYLRAQIEGWPLERL